MPAMTAPFRPITPITHNAQSPSLRSQNDQGHLLFGKGRPITPRVLNCRQGTHAKYYSWHFQIPGKGPYSPMGRRSKTSKVTKRPAGWQRCPTVEWMAPRRPPSRCATGSFRPGGPSQGFARGVAIAMEHQIGIGSQQAGLVSALARASLTPWPH